MKLKKANRRDRKISKAQNGMRISNRSIFTIQAVQIKRAEKAKGR
jgi:hypothetical protein